MGKIYFGPPQIVGPPILILLPIRIPLKPWGICTGSSCFLLGVSWRHPLRIKVWDCPSAWMVWLETSRFLIRRQICRLADGWEFMGLFMMNQQEYPKKKSAWIRWMVYPTKKSKNGKKSSWNLQLLSLRGNFLSKKKITGLIGRVPWAAGDFFSHGTVSWCSESVQWSCWRCEDQSPLEIFDATVNALTTFGLMVEVLSKSNFRST